MNDAAVRALLLGWAKSEGFAAIHNLQATDEQIVDDLLKWLDEHHMSLTVWVSGGFFPMPGVDGEKKQ